MNESDLMDPVQNSSMGSEDCGGCTQQVSPLCSHRTSWCCTVHIVQDGALPTRYGRELMSLEPIVKAAARRENDKAITITNFTAALWLDKFEKEKTDLQKHTKTTEEQIILACAKEPRRFQSRLQKILCTSRVCAQ